MYVYINMYINIFFFLYFFPEGIHLISLPRSCDHVRLMHISVLLQSGLCEQARQLTYSSLLNRPGSRMGVWC